MFHKIEVKYNDKKTMEIFKIFYKDTLVPNFKKNEIETYKQITDTLKKNKNTYYIFLYMNNEGYPAGGIVFDYLENTNTGFIEYLAVNNKHQKHGLGTKMIIDAVKKVNEDAKDNGFDRINFLACEVEKEKKIKKAKHYFWKKHGFKPLDFYYIQPPLGENKKAILQMEFGIVSKAPKAEYYFNFIDKNLIKEILYEYYDKYKEEKHFKEMIKKLDKQKIIKSKSIIDEDDYIFD